MRILKKIVVVYVKLCHKFGIIGKDPWEDVGTCACCGCNPCDCNDH